MGDVVQQDGDWHPVGRPVPARAYLLDNFSIEEGGEGRAVGGSSSKFVKFSNGLNTNSECSNLLN